MNILIIDWTNLLYRSYFSSKNLWMKNSLWINSWAFFFAINSFQKIKASMNFDTSKDKVIFTFDVIKSKLPRLEKFEWYKGTRKRIDDLTFYEQIDNFKKFIIWTKHDIIFEDYLEADDICWILAKWFSKNDKINHIYAYSSDKDYYQFINKKTTIIRPWLRWVLNHYTFDDYNKEYSNLSNEQFIELKAIVWDKSDNIIWLDWLWEKTWIKILKEFWSIEKWFSNENWIKKLPKKVRDAVLSTNEWKDWFETMIDWYKKDWKMVQEKITNIIKTNLFLAKLNITLDLVPEKNKTNLKVQLSKLFTKNKDLDYIKWYLDYYDIKKIKPNLI